MQRIDRFEFDEANESEMGWHAVSPGEADQVLDGDYRVIRNSGKHPNQPFIVVGRTAAGRWLNFRMEWQQTGCRHWS